MQETLLLFVLVLTDETSHGFLEQQSVDIRTAVMH